jgi:hypothetical protein
MSILLFIRFSRIRPSSLSPPRPLPLPPTVMYCYS